MKKLALVLAFAGLATAVSASSFAALNNTSVVCTIGDDKKGDDKKKSCCKKDGEKKSCCKKGGDTKSCSGEKK